MNRSRKSTARRNERRLKLAMRYQAPGPKSNAPRYRGVGEGLSLKPSREGLQALPSKAQSRTRPGTGR